jgi:hypothetical protein
MPRVIFTTSHDGNKYYATSENAANKFAEKKGLGSVFIKNGAPDADEMASATKVGSNVWLAAD